MNDVLIFDCETRTYGKPDPEKDRLKLFGCYSYKTKKRYILKDKEDIQKTINAHKFLVGFNNKGYDNRVLEREGLEFKYNIHIDLREIFKKRAGQMKIKAGLLGDLLMSYSLNFITKTIGIVDEHSGKKEIDYTMFQKDEWTAEEEKEIVEYLKRDIDVTRKLYEFVEGYFSGFKEFVTKEDIDKKKYLTCSIAVFAYKSLCKKLNIQETYNDITRVEKFEGGFVAEPAGERFNAEDGEILYFDYSSLYPNMFIQANLFGDKCDCCTQDEKWHGDGFFDVQGYYCTKKQSGVSEVLKEFYVIRDNLKLEKNPKEYNLKIVLNSSYGAISNPTFQGIHNLIAAEDCTSLGRQIIKYTRKRFKEEGYVNIMSDTDSNVVQIPKGKTKEDAMILSRKIVEEVQEHFPFSWDRFKLKLEDEVKYFYFFKGEDKKQFLKKNYVYVTKSNKLIIKNLGIRKKSISPLSKKIFYEHLVPKIKEGQIKFSKAYLTNIVNDLLKKDVSLATLRKEVGQAKQYKSESSLPAQISKKYGAGIHFFIPNTKGVGVGKGKSFCTLEEFNKRKMRVEDIDLSNVWQELAYFIKPVVVKNIFDFEK